MIDPAVLKELIKQCNDLQIPFLEFSESSTKGEIKCEVLGSTFSDGPGDRAVENLAAVFMMTMSNEKANQIFKIPSRVPAELAFEMTKGKAADLRKMGFGTSTKKFRRDVESIGFNFQELKKFAGMVGQGRTVNSVQDESERHAKERPALDL